MKRLTTTIFWLAFPCLVIGKGGQADELKTVNFNRDIRPILSHHCFQCHGPDENKRKADLRLDSPDGATRDLGGYAAVTPGRPLESELLNRVQSRDEELRMPPAEHGERLTEAQI